MQFCPIFLAYRLQTNLYLQLILLYIAFGVRKVAIFLRRVKADIDVENLASAVVHPEGRAARFRRLIRIGDAIGYSDSLTQLQQKILSTAISVIYSSGDFGAARTVCKIHINQFLELCNIKQDNMHHKLLGEIEKVASKGIWLYEKRHKRLIRTQWFQTIGYADGEITFQFTSKILELVAAIEPNDVDRLLIKGIQYRGKYTRAIFEIISSSNAKGVTEYSISELMRLLSLEHTRYSYGQLKLRVLEPSLQEIYDIDDSIFVQFGPTFSGRRVEEVWFKVTTGEEARKLREKEPKFKFASPKEKPIEQPMA
ncbi:hypothetical protein SPACI_005640 [Sporomusa acidovorans DSM 3132]|uniref:Initiator Rep protein WH1 domain-containing protein n=1 Tax=Sporomusa acidovorans (strain ATCC 49682 / DSM 3132 / Mol) TaxID=1123286 RepID=A0ABZ3IX27_SPOA4|nr:initiator replication protein [Sporomusa acidovorans DSM 3132]SDE43027.1 Initiator Replication protein [Sporomusa acidovorans]